MDRETRRLEDSKEPNIGFTRVTPSVRGMSEGQKLLARRGNKPLGLYIKELGHLWWTYLTRDGDWLVDRDLKVERNATISRDMVLKGHKNSQTFIVNVFQYPNPGTDWTPTITGAVLSGVLAAKKCWLPLNFLKIGDEIVSYKITGDLVETVGGCTFDCKLVRVNLADPITTTDVTGGGITTISVNGDFDALATLSSVETVATDKQYLLEIEATLTEAADFAYAMGAECKVNRK